MVGLFKLLGILNGGRRRGDGSGVSPHGVVVQGDASVGKGGIVDRRIVIVEAFMADGLVGLPVVLKTVDCLPGAVVGGGRGTFDALEGQQFDTVQRRAQNHIFGSIAAIGGIAGGAAMSQRVVAGNSGDDGGVACGLIGLEIGVEVTRVVIVNLITSVCLEGRNLNVIGVELVNRRRMVGGFYVPEPACAGTGTGREVFLPFLFTIYIECAIAVVIGVDGTALGGHDIVGFFLIELVWFGIRSQEFQLVTLTSLVADVEAVATVQVETSVIYIVGDVDVGLVS